MHKIKRAILSCHDKSGVVELASLLASLDVELISTAGTLRVLEEAGISAMNMADYTGHAEMLDGRVKSLHSKVHAGLLGLRDNKLHTEQMQALNLPWIDMVVVNQRGIANLIQKPGISLDEILDQIDAGGGAMVRSGAKNLRYVTVVVDPADYTTVMHEMRAHDGAVTFRTRCRLAKKAFDTTARIDQLIANYLDSVVADSE